MKYCRNCGAIYAESFHKYERDKCAFNNFPLVEDPNMTEEKFLKLSEEEKDAYELHIIELCKQSGYFDEHKCKRGKDNEDYYYTFRFDDYERLSGEKAWTKQNEEYHEMEAIKSNEHLLLKYGGGSDNQIKCPYCKSTSVKKISTTSRVVSTGLFGLASKKIGKQRHCNGCGSDF